MTGGCEGLYWRLYRSILTQSFLVSCLGLLNGVANNRFAFFVAAGDMAQEGDALHYPQEILDLKWHTTSKEKIQEAYKVWAGDYDRVCFELPKWFGSLPWENSLYLATPSLVFPQNDLEGRTAEMQYWWRVTTRQIWVVLLICWSKFPSRQDQSEAVL